MEFWILPGLQLAILVLTISQLTDSGSKGHPDRRRLRGLWLAMVVSTLLCTVLVLFPGSPAG